MNKIIQTLIAEAVGGRVVISGDHYNVGFNTVIVNNAQEKRFQKDNAYELLFPTLQITDYEKFAYTLTLYVTKAKKFYEEELKIKYKDYSDSDISKLLMSLVWANATSTDFRNPVEYLKKRINFLDDNIKEQSGVIEDISIFDNASIHYSIGKSPLVLETPYMLNAIVKNQDSYLNEYHLPNIYFGIDKDKVYIYAIQNKNRKENDNKTKFNKMVRRNLNKVKMGFVGDENLDAMEFRGVEEFNINHPENMTSVDPATLVSLTVALAILKENGINEIIVPDFFPVRYNSSLIITNIKAGNKPDYMKKPFLEEEANRSDRINRNIVDKKIRSFRRLSSHFEFLEIYTFPKELDDNMHIMIGDNYSCNNEVLDEIYGKVTSSIDKNRGINCKKNKNR